MKRILFPVVALASVASVSATVECERAMEENVSQECVAEEQTTLTVIQKVALDADGNEVVLEELVEGPENAKVVVRKKIMVDSEGNEFLLQESVEGVEDENAESEEK